jgi:hypothetical protein
MLFIHHFVPRITVRVALLSIGRQRHTFRQICSGRNNSPLTQATQRANQIPSELYAHYSM